MTKPETLEKIGAIYAQAAKIVNPTETCVLCGEKVVNKIYRREDGMIMFYRGNDARANNIAFLCSKLLCDKHMRHGFATGYKPLRKKQTDIIGQKLSEIAKQGAILGKQSNDKDLMKVFE
jgi:hypothetical protein